MNEKYILYYKGRRFLLEWIKDNNFEKYKPIKQVYGIVYGLNMNVLIGRKASDKPWALMGGTPEDGETVLQALERELIEEADATFKDPILLGVQKSTEIDSSGVAIGDSFYQARVVAKLNELLDQTPDPDSGIIWERKLVPIDELEEYLNWGSAAVAMIEDAKEVMEEALK